MKMMGLSLLLVTYDSIFCPDHPVGPPAKAIKTEVPVKYL